MKSIAATPSSTSQPHVDDVAVASVVAPRAKHR
jgi:hypothetical protein